MEDQIKKLTLLLLYLTSWEEKVPSWEEEECVQKCLLRSWKGYPFESLDKLEEEGLIAQRRKNKSVYLTEKGIKQAEDLKKKLRGY
ncbi:DUF6429 family protein [Candidatus Omnitrophota bacterium]